MDTELTPDTLQSFRGALKISRADLAAASGINETTIMRIEAGKDPRVKNTWFPIVRAIEAIRASRAA